MGMGYELRRRTMRRAVCTNSEPGRGRQTARIERRRARPLHRFLQLPLGRPTRRNKPEPFRHWLREEEREDDGASDAGARMTEHQRLEAVRRYNIVDTPSDGAFDRITAIAAQLLNVPIAIISIVDHDRIWFTSKHGIEIDQVDRDLGLCASCILQEEAWIVGDAKTDLRALANPLVAGRRRHPVLSWHPTPHPRRLQSRHALRARHGAAHRQQGRYCSSHDLAAVVMDQLELRLAARRASADFHEELAARELREDHIKGLLRELAHRSKNLLAVVLATAGILFRVISGQRVRDALGARIQGLAPHARTHRGSGLARRQPREAGARQIGDRSRLGLAGPHVTLVPAAAQHIGMALHEFAANAARHGALSSGDGRVSFGWHLAERAPSQSGCG